MGNLNNFIVHEYVPILDLMAATNSLGWSDETIEKLWIAQKHLSG